MTTPMDVHLLVHLEEAAGTLVWWGEVPEVPGFSVNGPALAEMILRASWALADALAEDGIELGQIEIDLVTDEPATSNPVVSSTDDGDTPGTTGDQVQLARVAKAPTPVGAAA